MSQTSPQEVRFCFVWKINALPTNNSLVSSKFHIQNELIYLQVTYRPNCHENYGLVLHRDKNCGNPSKRFTISVLFESMDGTKISDSRVTASVVNYPVNLLNFSGHINFGCARCNSNALSNFGAVHMNNVHANGFKIICLFHGDFSSLLSEPYDSDFPPNLKSLSLDLANLLKNKTLADVKLQCGNHIIPAHKSVLAARSEVFAAMFQNQMVESNSGDVKIEDVEALVIELFLMYVYTGKIPNVSEDVLPGLYAAADKYAVLALKESCREVMISKLSKENYINFLVLSDAHNDLDFKKAVINFICKYEEILEEEAWMNFIEEPSKLSIEVYKEYVKQKKSEKKI